MLLALLLLSANTWAVKLYKWTDSDGQVFYQDEPPPSGQRFEEKSFSDQGTNTLTNAALNRANAVIQNPVALYTAANCESCDLIRTVLEMNQIPFQNIEVQDNPSAQQALMELVGALRVPSLMIGETVVGEFDRSSIEDILKESGYPYG